MKKVYAILSFLGAVVTYAYFLPFLLENGE